MKKIINNASYDTTKAVCIGHKESDCQFNNDLSYWRERLFKTKSGKYFLHGEGNAMSKYSESRGNGNRGAGEEIIPLTAIGASEWAEENLDAEDFEKEFGEVVEASDDKVAITLSITVDKKARLEKMRTATGKSISKIIEEAIDKM